MSKEFKNQFEILGKVKEVNAYEGTSQKTGVPYINVKVDIEVRKEIDGEKRVNVFRVGGFASEQTSKGEKNKLYPSFKKVAEEYKEGDVVRVRGRVGVYEKYTDEGDYRCYQNFDFSSIHRLTEEEKAKSKPKALATIDTVVLDSHTEDNGDTYVDCFTLDWKDEMIKLNKVFIKSDLADQFLSLYYRGTTGQITYELLNYPEIEEVSQTMELESAFGTTERVETASTFTRKVEGMEIKGGSHPYTDGKALLEDEINEIIAKHDQKLNEMKGESNLVENTGFGNTTDNTTITENDLPFTGEEATFEESPF